MKYLNLKVLNDTYQVVKLEPNDNLPKDIFNREFYSITKTEEEISVVASSKIAIQSNYIENGWKIIKISGMLDFELIGVLSEISKILADNKISIFVMSTYNTDYILIKEQSLNKAMQALTNNNYSFE